MPETNPDVSQSLKARTGVSVQILDRYDWTVKRGFELTTFDGGLKWVDELHGEGWGSFRIPLDHGILHRGLGEMRLGNLAACSYNGVRRFTFRIEHSGPVSVSQAEDAGKWWEVSGPGLLGVLADGTVLPASFDPEAKIELLTMDEVAFTAAHRDYDDSAWPTATAVKQVNVATEPFLNQPPGWLDPDAYWINHPLTDYDDDFAESADSRLLYFRRGFSLDSEMELTFFAAAEGRLKVVIDGNTMLETRTPYRIGTVETRLAAGEHQIYCEYRPRPSADDTGWVMSWGRQTGVSGGEPVFEWLGRTNNNWLAWHNSNPPPGPQVGWVVRKGFNQVRDLATYLDMPSTLQQVRIGFDDDVDTDGNTWETVQRYFQVGTSLFNMVMGLAELGCEFRMSPFGRFKGYQGECGEDKSSTVHLRVGDSITELGHTIEWAGSNFILGRWTGGWLQRHRRRLDNNDMALHLRMGVGPMGNVDSHTQAGKILNTALHLSGRSWGRRLSVVHPIGGPHPFGDYDVGDYVGAPKEDGEIGRHRILALGVSVDGNGLVTFTPDVSYEPLAS